MKLLGLTDSGVRHSTDAGLAAGTVPAGTAPPPAGSTATPGAAGGEGNGKPAEGAPGNGSLTPEVMAKRLDDLARENETLRGTVKSLEAESIGRKKKIQGLEGVIGELSPSEVADRLKRVEELDHQEALRKGEWEKLQEASRNSVVKERELRVAAEKREEDRVVDLRITQGASANNPLSQAMTIPPGADRAPILAMTRGAFEYDRDTGEVVHRTERNPETGRKLTPEEFFHRERTKSLAFMFASGVLPGGGASAKGAEGAGGDVVEIAHDDPMKVEKASALDKAGKKWTITRNARA